MKVLIADFDLFHQVGGGQTCYRNIILRNPQMHFYYLRERESADSPRPPNAHPIRYVRRYEPSGPARLKGNGVPPWVRPLFTEANNIAFSAQGRRFDVVDVPDYRCFGGMLRPALWRHGVGADKVALAMHGRISTTIAMNWSTEGVVNPAVVAAEDMQYAAADVRYFLSETYRDEWRAGCDLPAQYIDPMWFFSFEDPQPYVGAPHAPSLNFIGRTEKRKGPHVFLQLLWWLPESCYHEANFIGGEDVDSNGTRSSDHLRSIAASRKVAANYRGPMTPASMARLYASKAVTVVPSLYDTLNLVALESLLSGCPTAVGDGAGVCRYLRDRYPQLPFVTIRMDRPLESVPLLESVLRHYDDHRAELAGRLRQIDKRPVGPGLESAYAARPEFDSGVRMRLDDYSARLHRQCSFRLAAA